MIGWIAFKEVRNVNLVLVVFVVSVGKDIGALKRLRAIAKNVVDDEDGGRSA